MKTIFFRWEDETQRKGAVHVATITNYRGPYTPHFTILLNEKWHLIDFYQFATETAVYVQVRECVEPRKDLDHVLETLAPFVKTEMPWEMT